MRLSRNLIVAFTATAVMATSSVSRRAEAHPAAIGMGIALVLWVYGLYTGHQSELPNSYEENLARNLEAMETACVSSEALASKGLYRNFYKFNREKFFPRFKDYMVKNQNAEGLQMVDRLEKLKLTDQTSFDWNVTNLVVAASNLVVERNRQKDGAWKRHYYTAFTQLRNWDTYERLQDLDHAKCGLKNVITESNASLVALTQPTDIDPAMTSQAGPALRKMMEPVMDEMEKKGDL